MVPNEGTIWGSSLGFALAAAALLGSPGPGIAALVATGRLRGVTGGLPYFAAMQMGLMLAAAVSAAGLVSIIAAIPFLYASLAIISVAYLLWLAWSVASAPLSGSVGSDISCGALTRRGGFLLGIANPKAYFAFAGLYGSFAILSPPYGFADGLMKWAICALVMIVVDFAWLSAGATMARIAFSPGAERAMNVVMGMAIVAACAMTIV